MAKDFSSYNYYYYYLFLFIIIIVFFLIFALYWCISGFS